jgi:hypothetical protein
MNTKTVLSDARRWRIPALCGGVFAVALSARPAVAASPCPLGFRPGSEPTINGIRSPGEWDDASLTSSGNGCLGTLLDLDEGVAATRNINVYTKRYARSTHTGVVPYLGFFFEIPDHTVPGVSGPLNNGERILLQFDPNLSGGPTLENGALAINKDYRIEIRHGWQSAGTSDPDLLVPYVAGTDTTDGVRVTVLDGSGSDCGNPTWAPVNLPGVEVTLRKNTFGSQGSGYQAEIGIPLSLLGNPTGDMGVAFAVLNDFAGCGQPGVCDGYGTSYPSGLPVNNSDNPVVPCMTGGWTVPSAWATGYVSSAPADVYYSPTPSYYFSDDIDDRRCTVIDNNWYNARPCKVGIRSWLRSASGVDQTRNVAYYFAKRGMGQTEWHFLSMSKAISVPASAGSGGVARRQDDSADKSINLVLSDHPCVRAYILPSSLRPDFDEGRISGGASGILNDSDLEEMSAKYGLQPQHSAQQNITLQNSASCPDSSCLASLVPPRVSRQQMAEAETAPSPSPSSSPGSTALRWLESVAGISRAHAAGGGDLVARTKPLSRTIGNQVLLSGTRMEKYAGDNVMVQIRAFGYRASAVTTTPRYNFLEEIGAIIKLIPVALLQEGGPVPLDFELGNPGQAQRVILLTVDMKAPKGVVIPPLNLDTTPQLFQPHETRHMTASLGAPSGPSCRQSQWLPYLVLALVLLGIIIKLLRRRQATP